MKLQGHGVLRSEDGRITTEGQYSITLGKRKQGKTTHTLGGSLPPIQGKKEPDSVSLITDRKILSSETQGYFILETEDNHCFRLVIDSVSLDPNLIVARGTEIKCP